MAGFLVGATVLMVRSRSSRSSTRRIKLADGELICLAKLSRYRSCHLPSTYSKRRSTYISNFEQEHAASYIAQSPLIVPI